MLATAGELPVGPGWAYELKWDGVRAVAQVSRGALRLYARSGAEITAAYPELAGMANAIPMAELVCDGEIVLLDAAGKPSFTALAERMHVREQHRAAALAAARPVTYLIFDLIRADGIDVTELPYRIRREQLKELVPGGQRWAVPPNFEDGPATMAAARDLGLEGVVAKRLDSVYRTGLRSTDWIKVKDDKSGDFVVGGWRPGARELGALLVGLPRPDGLLDFRGRVGGGISANAQRELLRQLKPLGQATSPFFDQLAREDSKGATFVRPQLVVEVKYGNITPDNRLRFPRFVRIRSDKSAAEATDA